MELMDTCSYCHKKSPILTIRQSSIDGILKRRAKYAREIHKICYRNKAARLIRAVMSPDYVMNTVKPVCPECDRKLLARDKEYEPLEKTLSNIKEYESRELKRRGLKNADWFQNELSIEKCMIFDTGFHRRTSFAEEAFGIYCYKFKKELSSIASNNTIEVLADLLLGNFLPIPKGLSDDERWKWKVANWGVPFEICGIKTYDPRHEKCIACSGFECSPCKIRKTIGYWFATFSLNYSFESACAPPFKAIKTISGIYHGPIFHLSYHRRGDPTCNRTISYKFGRRISKDTNPIQAPKQRAKPKKIKIKRYDFQSSCMRRKVEEC